MVSTDLDSTPGNSQPQAGPLPRKRGELGYQEGADTSLDDNGQLHEPECLTPLPARHPADTQPSPDYVIQPSTPVEDMIVQLAPGDNTSMECAKVNGRVCVLGRFFRCKKKFLGVQLTLVLRFFVQFILLSGTIVAWVILSRKLMGHLDGSNGGDEAAISGTASIFVHVTFGIATFSQLLYLERCIFLIRAQRYAHTHRTEGPHSTQEQDSSGHPPISLAISLAPWNRPPLPTYAAALAEVNPGTGDVEDLEIAVPPPPAYGHTRDSTLLLANITRESLNQDSISRRSSMIRGIRPGSRISQRGRPASLRSFNGNVDGRADAERALRLAETLDALESGSGTSMGVPKP